MDHDRDDPEDFPKNRRQEGAAQVLRRLSVQYGFHAVGGDGAGQEHAGTNRNEAPAHEFAHPYIRLPEEKLPTPGKQCDAGVV